MSNNRNVLIVAPSAYPLGGVAVWLSYLVPGLEKHNWKVLLGLVKGKHHDVERYLSYYPQLQSVVEIPVTTGSRINRINSLIRTFKNQQPDIILAVNIVDIYEAARRYRKLAKKPFKLVTTIHAIEHDLLEDIRKNKDVVDAVITTNRLTQAVVHQHCFIPMERILYAPYGVDVYDDPKNKISGALTIGYCGRFEQEQKRVHDIPNILKQLVKLGKSWKMLLAGDGPESSLLKESLSSYESSGKVEFLGQIQADDMAENFYKRCDILLIPSSWETGPIVAWEAMANGVAVVSSQYVGSILEGALVDGENCLLFPVGDHVKAASCIQSLQSPVLFAHIVDKAKWLVESRYTRERSLQQWDACLKQILLLPELEVTDSNLQKSNASGRLDRVFGVSIADSIRQLLGVRYEHKDAGGEWPHSYSTRGQMKGFLEEMEDLERTFYKR